MRIAVVGTGVSRNLAAWTSDVTATILAPADPITNLETTYGRSKAEGERYARGLQADGAPLVVVYPAGVYGPDDPVPGEVR